VHLEGDLCARGYGVREDQDHPRFSPTLLLGKSPVLSFILFGIVSTVVVVFGDHDFGHRSSWADSLHDVTA